MIVWFKIKQNMMSSRYHEKSNYSKTRPTLKNSVEQMKLIDEFFIMFFSDFKNIENWTNDIGLNWFLTLKYDPKNMFYEIHIGNLINKYYFIFSCILHAVSFLKRYLDSKNVRPLKSLNAFRYTRWDNVWTDTWLLTNQILKS